MYFFCPQFAELLISDLACCRAWLLIYIPAISQVDLCTCWIYALPTYLSPKIPMLFRVDSYLLLQNNSSVAYN